MPDLALVVSGPLLTTHARSQESHRTGPRAHLLLDAGVELTVVAAQLRHRDPKLTATVLRRSEE
jgi:hypothetical protein